MIGQNLSWLLLAWACRGRVVGRLWLSALRLPRLPAATDAGPVVDPGRPRRRLAVAAVRLPLALFLRPVALLPRALLSIESLFLLRAISLSLHSFRQSSL